MFGDRELAHKQNRVNFDDLQSWYRPFLIPTHIFKGFEAPFFTRPADRTGRESTTLKT